MFSQKMAIKKLNAWQKKVDEFHKQGNHEFCPVAWECNKTITATTERGVQLMNQIATIEGEIV